MSDFTTFINFIIGVAPCSFFCLLHRAHSKFMYCCCARNSHSLWLNNNFSLSKWKHTVYAYNCCKEYIYTAATFTLFITYFLRNITCFILTFRLTARIRKLLRFCNLIGGKFWNSHTWRRRKSALYWFHFCFFLFILRKKILFTLWYLKEKICFFFEHRDLYLPEK